MIAVIGIGYVGLPLALNLGKYFDVVAFDVDKLRINELKKGFDRNLEFKKKQVLKKKINYSYSYNSIKNCNIYIVTLPTPINIKKLPDIKLVLEATKSLSKILKVGDTVIYESTFYPGTVEEELIPILEVNSNLVYKKDFFVGYSPERINPGDRIHTFSNVKKIIAANDKISIKKLKFIYERIVDAGVHVVESIKVAELSKLLENTQRFINIALMNEISTICNKIGIHSKEVIDAASSKWNFNKYVPGIVGGHCIAVDPLYLSYKQKKLGLSSKLIEIADSINSNKHLEIISKLKNRLKNIKTKKILILGITFKENCPDLRNSGSINLIKSLNKLNVIPFIHDPLVSKETIKKEFNYKFNYIKKLIKSDYDCIIISVAHNFYKSIKINKLKNISTKKDCIIFDLKSIYKKEEVYYQL